MAFGWVTSDRRIGPEAQIRSDGQRVAVSGRPRSTALAIVMNEHIRRAVQAREEGTIHGDRQP